MCFTEGMDGVGLCGVSEWGGGGQGTSSVPIFHLTLYIYIYIHINTGAQQALLDEHSGCFDILSHPPGEETDSQKYLLVSDLVNGY